MGDDTMTFQIRKGLTLPLRTQPIRFAVEWRNGLTSNAWGVYVEKTGDAYISCRDHMKDQKVSLHASGKQHITVPHNTAAGVYSAGDRFMNQWWEPQYTQKAVATFHLIFPPWGLRLNAEQRRKFQNVWDKNTVLIPGDDKRLTVVYFVIMDDNKRLRKEEGSPPSGPLGVLKLRPGKLLVVLAGYEPEGSWQETVDKALKDIVSTTDPKLLEGDDLTLCLTGNRVENSVFMLPLSVRYNPPTKADSM